MRYLTPDELRRVLERGPENLPDLTPAEIVEALAVEVSERRLAETAGPRVSKLTIGDIAALAGHSEGR